MLTQVSLTEWFFSEFLGYHTLRTHQPVDFSNAFLGRKLRGDNRRSLAKTEASQKLQEIRDMIWIAKVSFGGGVSKILFCPMIVCFEEEVIWSNPDHYPLIKAPGAGRWGPVGRGWR